MRLEHIAWQVADPPAVAAWYGRHLGFTVRRKVDQPPHTHFIADASGVVMIELYHNPSVPVPDYAGQDPLLLHLAFVVTDLAAERARLLAAGATVAADTVTTSAGDQLLMLRDPWGFPVQLVTRAEPML